MTTLTLSPNQVKERLRVSLKADVPCFIMGSPSTAKSHTVRAVCEEEGLYMIDVRLSQLMPYDLCGMPKVMEMTNANGESGAFSTYIPFDTFPLEGCEIPQGYKGFCIFFDEANQADKFVQGALYRIVLDRMVHTYKLHPETRIVLAGNKLSDNAVATKMSSALKSRMTWINVEINKKEFLQFVEDGVVRGEWDPRVAAFLNFRPELINNFDPKKEVETYACGRTWEFLSKELQAGLLDLGQDIYIPAIAGTIGESAAAEFNGFLQIMNSLPSLAQIEKDPLKAPLPVENGAKYALGAFLADKVHKLNVDAVVDYLERIDEKDLMVLAYRMILGRYPLLATNKKVLNSLGAIRHKLNNQP